MPAPLSSNSSDAYVYRWMAQAPLVVCHPYLTPNVVTLLGCVAGLLGVYLMASPTPPWAAVVALITVRALADCLDGAIARHCGTSSALGKTLDTVSDHVFFLALSVVFLYKLFAHTRLDLSVFVGALLFVTIAATYLANSWITLHLAPSRRRRRDELANRVSGASWILRQLHDNSVLSSVLSIVGIALFFSWNSAATTTATSN